MNWHARRYADVVTGTKDHLAIRGPAKAVAYLALLGVGFLCVFWVLSKNQKGDAAVRSSKALSEPTNAQPQVDTTGAPRNTRWGSVSTPPYRKTNSSVQFAQAPLPPISQNNTGITPKVGLTRPTAGHDGIPAGAKETGTRSVTEAQIKAAFLVNFLRYAVFPQRAFANSSSPYLVFSDDQQVFEVLEKQVGAKKINERATQAAFVSINDSLEMLPHLFYSGSSVSGSLSHPFTNGEPVLTVGDAPDFLRKGGMIQLVESQGRFSFRINRAAIDRSGIVLSPRLLQLADQHP